MGETIWRDPLGRRAGRSIPHVIDAHREFCVWHSMVSAQQYAARRFRSHHPDARNTVVRENDKGNSKPS